MRARLIFGVMALALLAQNAGAQTVRLSLPPNGIDGNEYAPIVAIACPAALTQGATLATCSFGGSGNFAAGTTGVAPPTYADYMAFANAGGLLTGVSPTNPLPAQLYGTLPSPNQNTPAACTTTTIATGGTAVTLITGPIKGGTIKNPLTAGGQGIATAENAYISLTGTATTTEGGAVFSLEPGVPFVVPALATGSNISFVAATASHKLSCTVW